MTSTICATSVWRWTTPGKTSNRKTNFSPGGTPRFSQHTCPPWQRNPFPSQLSLLVGLNPFPSAWQQNYHFLINRSPLHLQGSFRELHSQKAFLSGDLQSGAHTKVTVLLPLALTPTMAHFLPKMLVNFYLLLLGRGTTLPFWGNTISMQTSQKYWSRTTFWDLGFHLFGKIEVYLSENLVFPRFHKGN